MAQLGPAIPEIEASGAKLVVVGNGTPFMARAFLEDHPLRAAVYVDPELKVYEAAGLKRGIRRTLTHKSIGMLFQALKHGRMQGLTQGDNWQQGGTFVVVPGGDVKFTHISRHSADYPSNEKVLKVLRQLNSSTSAAL